MDNNKHLVRGKDIKSNIWVEDTIFEIIRDKFFINYGEVDAKSVGKFTGLTEDTDFIDYTIQEPKDIFEGDILNLFYNEKSITCVVAWEICGFLLGSHYFEDSYIWLTEVMENQGDYYWIRGLN